MANTHDKIVNIITMGCSKNLVDSERLIKMFENAGYSVVHNPEKVKGGIVIVNTCGFIGDAKEESIDMILECCQAKAKKRVRKVYVMGCLSQRYAQQLPTEIPEVDGWYGKFDWEAIIHDLAKEEGNESVALHPWDRTLTTAPHQAFLKIAEGCNRFCAYCAIPLITGRFKSRPIDEIIDEVRVLVQRGVKEFNVIAQDLSSYGLDLYGHHALAQLVEEMAQVQGVKWIRLHYAYPTDFPYDVLPVMAKYPNVCKYLDIALQHISDKVLDNMRRNITGEQTRELLARIRSEVPGIHIRTTLMTGFPGEGEEEFEELKAFVREQKFERMGAFAYCEEEDTYGAKHFADDIPQDVKQDRLDQIMAIQEEIAQELNDAMIEKTITVVVDSCDDEYYHCRTEFDSPDVDQEVLIPVDSANLKVGDFYKARITDALPFDLIAEITNG